MSKKQQSAFLEFFGDSLPNRMLDFLIEGNMFSYSVSDVAEYLHSSRELVSKWMAVFTELGIVKKTGKSKVLYKLNNSSPAVKGLICFDDMLSKKAIRKARYK